MIRRKEILISILLSLSVAMCGCSSSEKQKSEETTGKSETVVTESTKTSADDSSTSDTEKETTTESSTESETESSSEEESSTASSAIPENLSPDEMEKAFLQYCDDNGIQYFTSEENGGIRYECRELRFVVEKHPDSASAEKVYKEVLDYGGWYEEDLVTRDVIIDEEGKKMQAYYCQAEDGLSMLFVLAQTENLHFSTEAIGEDQVKTAEGILQAMGVDLSSRE